MVVSGSVTAFAPDICEVGSAFFDKEASGAINPNGMARDAVRVRIVSIGFERCPCLTMFGISPNLVLGGVTRHTCVGASVMIVPRLGHPFDEFFRFEAIKVLGVLPRDGGVIGDVWTEVEDCGRFKSRIGERECEDVFALVAR